MCVCVYVKKLSAAFKILKFFTIKRTKKTRWRKRVENLFSFSFSRQKLSPFPRLRTTKCDLIHRICAGKNVYMGNMLLPINHKKKVWYGIVETFMYTNMFLIYNLTGRVKVCENTSSLLPSKTVNLSPTRNNSAGSVKNFYLMTGKLR